MASTPPVPPPPAPAEDTPELGHVEILAFDTETYGGGVYSDSTSLHAWLSVIPRVAPGLPLDAARIRAAVVGTGLLLTDVDEKRIDEALVPVAAGQSIRMVLITEGIPPRGGGDPRLDWAIDYTQTRTQDSESRVDYHEKANIRNVRTGEKLLTVIPPPPAEPGRDVFGHPVHPPKGRDQLVTAGENVRYEPESRTYTATADGRLVFIAGRVEVSPILNVEADVDYSTGNIVFNGFVHIAGSVLDSFRVKADKGMYIGGAVGMSTLESGADVEIAGGVAAKGKGSITAAGTVKAKYLNAVSVEAQGDVLIRTEILNCNVSALGKVRVQMGSICGGEVIAMGGVHAPVLGSAMGVKTYVAAGVNFTSEKRLRELRELYLQHAKTVKMITDKVGPLMEDREKLLRLPPDKLAVVRGLMAQLKDARSRLAEVEAEQNRMLEHQQMMQDKTIAVARRVCSGVDVQVGEYRKTFIEDLEGPVRLYYNEAEGVVKSRRL